MQIHKHYPSISALIALGCPDGINADQWTELQTHVPDRSNMDWFGVKGGREEVKRIVATGWAEGVKRIFDALGRMTLSTATDVRRRRCRGAEGDELDIHRIWSGRFDSAWSRTHRAQAIAPKHVRIVMQIGALANVPAERMFWRGAACVAIADALEEAGYAVEIMGYSRALDVYDHTHESCITFPIKAYEQPLSVTDVAATACLAGFHRHYIFGARNHCERSCSSGYGQTTVGIPDALMQEDDDPPIHVSLKDVSSEETCRVFVDAALKPYQ